MQHVCKQQQNKHELPGTCSSLAKKEMKKAMKKAMKGKATLDQMTVSRAYPFVHKSLFALQDGTSLL